MSDPRWTADGNGVGRGEAKPGWEATIICHGHDRFVMAPFVADALNDAARVPELEAGIRAVAKRHMTQGVGGTPEGDRAHALAARDFLDLLASPAPDTGERT